MQGSKKRKGSASPVEWMIVTAAREIRDREVLMVGTQWPIPVALLAKGTHAPGCILCFEGASSWKTSRKGPRF